ncbi:hypothetical protein HELRODRAFT_188005 [Helobdella robusta]|uniref:K Homology domain-containing protein n=1 Tax=Helobdella robusta TaxID=6412 RepID=T1FPJ4_HELRO|nr:hypothetical protein HELRODRAFT_188005 [Helobdella robusta]ESO12839.1 hypothetical protein HELRODRAFT_188005 [Helobdella robusta]
MFGDLHWKVKVYKDLKFTKFNGKIVKLDQNITNYTSSSDNSDDDDDEEEDEDYEETECSVKHGMKALYVKQYRNLQPCSLVSAGHPNQKWKHEHKSGGMLALKKQRLKHQKKPFSSSHQELRFNDGHHLKHFITSSLSSANIPKTKADKKHSRSNTIATSIISASSSLSSSSVPLCGHNHLDHDEETCGMCGCLKAMKTMEEVDRSSQLECQTCPPISTAGRQHPGDDKCCRLHHHQTVCSLHRSIKTMNNNSLQQFSQHSLQQHHQLTSDSSNGCNLANCVDQCGSNSDCEPIKSQLEAQTVGNLETALTLSCSRGHVELVCLLLSKGSNIEHRDKKGFTPLLHAANFGHSKIVEILVGNGADVEAETERTKDTALSLACASSEKVVKYLVSQVSQLPSDAECGKLLKSFSEIDKPELKNSCMKCLEIIKKAKEAQAMKAYENATILLNELQQEKKLEAKKRAAREKKREKRKQKKKDRFASGSTTPNSSNLNNNGNTARDSSVDVKTANSSASPGVSDEDKPEPSSRLTASDEDVAGKENNPKCLIASKSSATTNSSVDTNTIDNKKRKSNRIDRGHQSSDVKESTPVPNHKDQVKVRIASNTATSGLPLQESKVQLNQCPEKSRKDSIPLLKTKLSGIGDLDDFALLPSTLHTNIVAAPVLLASLGTQKMKNDSKSAKLPLDNLKETSYTHKSGVLATTKVTPAGISTTTLVATAQKPLLSTIPSQPAPVHVTYKPALALNNVSTNAKSFVKKKITPGSSIVPSSNSVLLKKDDSFLLNKDPQRKTRKVDVPARAVSRVIGRAGCNINAIREFSGAKIDLDKLKTCDDAVVTIRGTNESVNKAGELILALVRESDKDIDQLITAFKQQQLSGGVSLLGSSSSSNSVEVSTTNVWKTGNSLLMKNSITIPSCVSIASTVRESVSLIPPNNVWESRKMQSSLNNEASKTTNNAWLKSTNNKETNSNYGGSRPTVISTLNMSGSNVWDNSMADGIGKAPGSGLSVPEDKPEPITTFPIGAWKSVSKSSDIRSTNSFAHLNDSVPNVQSPSNHPSNAKEDFSWVKAQDAPTTTFSETIIRTTAAVSMTQSTLMPAVSVANTSSSSTSDSTSLSSTSSSVQQFLSYQANPQSPLLHSYSGKLPSSIAPISAVQEPAAEYSPFGDYGSSFLNNSVVTTSSSSIVSSNLIASHSDVTIDKSKAPGYRPPSFQNRSQSPTREQLPVFQNNVNVPGFVSACNSLNSDKYSDSNRYVPNDNESVPSSSAYHYLLPSEQQHSIKTTNVESATISVAAAIDNNSSYQSIITPMVNSTLNPNAPKFNSKPTSISPQMFYKSNLPSMYSSGMKYNLQPHLDPSNVPKMHQQQQQNIPINSSNDLQMFPNVNPGYSNIDGSNLSYQGSHQTSMPVEYSQRRFSFSEGIAASNSNKSVVKSNEVNTTSSIYQSPSIHQHSFTPYTTTTLSYQQQRQQSYSVDHYMRRFPGQLQPIGTERNSKKQLVFSAISTSASTLSSSSASPLSLASVSISSPLSSLVTAVQPSVTTIIPLVPKSNLMVAGPVGPTVADHLANNMVAPPWNYHPGMSRSSTNTAQQLNNNTAMLNIPSSTYLYNNVYNNNVGSSAAAAAAAAAASTRPAQVFNHHGPAYSPNLNNLPSNQYVIPNGSTLPSAYHGRLTPQLHPQQHYQQQQQLQQPQQQQNSFFYHHSSSYPRFPHEMEGWQMGVHENHGDDLQAWNLWNSVDNSRK